jgi:hypothetical protein
MIALAALPAALKGALAGTVIALAPTTGRVVILNVHAAGVTLDLAGSTLTELAIYRSGGITVKGANLAGSKFSAIMVQDSDHIVLADPHCQHFGGACWTKVIGGLANHYASADGGDISGSQRITVTGWRCVADAPVNANHPDCVQMWSYGGHLASDIVVENSVAIGGTMGFDAYGHGVSSNVTRVTLRNNTAALTYPNCWALEGATASVATGNRCKTLPGAKWQVRAYPLHAPDLIARGNVDGQKP